MKKFFGTLVVVATGFLALAFATQPASLEPWRRTPIVEGDIDEYLQSSESRIDEKFGIIPGTEKRVRWQPAKRSVKTPRSIVYFHGFSATRQEIAPVAEMIADRIGANLFETRLRGHGRKREQLSNVVAEEWLVDAAEALTIGADIGNDVILIGTSTGGTVILAMLNHPQMQHVSDIVLISPNLVVRDTNSELLTKPGGPLAARLIIGKSSSWEPHNEVQGRYWTTTYPLASVIEMMRLVNLARLQTAASIEQRLLSIASPLDQVVDPIGSKAYISNISAPVNEHVDFMLAKDPSNHVLAGNILSPSSNEPMANIIVEFLQR